MGDQEITIRQRRNSLLKGAIERAADKTAKWKRAVVPIDPNALSQAFRDRLQRLTQAEKAALRVRIARRKKLRALSRSLLLSESIRKRWEEYNKPPDMAAMIEKEKARYRRRGVIP